MATKIILYIGSDNKTKKISEEYKQKVEQILAKYWQGFTLKKCEGYYKGEIEESLEAIIFVLKFVFKDLENCIDDLKVSLVQESIGVEVVVNVRFKLK